MAPGTGSRRVHLHAAGRRRLVHPHRPPLVRLVHGHGRHAGLAGRRARRRPRRTSATPGPPPQRPRRTLATARQARDAAVADAATAREARDSALAQLATAQGQLSSTQSQLTSAQTELATAQGALATAQAGLVTARDQAAELGARVVKGYVEQWGMLYNATAPAANQVATTGSVGSLFAYWPVNPFTGQPMADSARRRATSRTCSTRRYLLRHDAHTASTDVSLDGTVPPQLKNALDSAARPRPTHASRADSSDGLDRYALDQQRHLSRAASRTCWGRTSTPGRRTRGPTRTWRRARPGRLHLHRQLRRLHADGAPHGRQRPATRSTTSTRSVSVACASATRTWLPGGRTGPQGVRRRVEAGARRRPPTVKQMSADGRGRARRTAGGRRTRGRGSR